MGHLIGIDLGTSNTVAAALIDGRRACVALDGASRMLPSCAAVGPDGDVLIGSAAKARPDGVREWKRAVGTPATYRLGTADWTALELNTLLLRTVKERFEAAHGPAEGAVVTVPANFLDAQRREVREAGTRAGLNVLRIINEPSAAAIAYSLSSRPPDGLTLVVDWGGGTLDVSLLDCDDDVLDIKAVDGDPLCGGRDVDYALAEAVIASRPREFAAASFSDAARARLAAACERLKTALSAEDSATTTVDLLGDGREIEFSLTRADLERAAAPLVRRVMTAIARALAKAPEGRKLPRDVRDVLLVGGSSRLDLLRREIAQIFGREGRSDLDPLEAVAVGAAYEAERARGDDSLLVLHSLGTNLGVRAGGIDGDGVTRNDLFSVIIPAGTKIPYRKSETYTTSSDGQTVIDIEVFEGEGARIAGCRPLDRRKVTGLPPAPQGALPIVVSFDYDIEQILHVTVEVAAAGIRREWRIARSEELEAGRADSAKKLSALGAGTASAYERFARRVKDALPPAGADRTKRLLTALETALTAGDLERARRLREELSVAAFQDGVKLA